MIMTIIKIKNLHKKLNFNIFTMTFIKHDGTNHINKLKF
jgi:hypothetical protein